MSKENQNYREEIDKRSSYIISTLDKISRHSPVPPLVARKADGDYALEIRKLSRRRDRQKGWEIIYSRGKMILDGVMHVEEITLWTFSENHKGEEEVSDPEIASYIINTLSDIALSVNLLETMSGERDN